MIRIPTVDADYPVIAYQLSYLGTADELQPYLDRFIEAGPTVVSIAENVLYKDYYTATQNGVNQSACKKDQNILGYSVSLPGYNKTAIRTSFGYLSALTADPRYNTSAWLLESYGSRGVWAQDYNSTSLPPAERDLPVLTVPITWWAGDDASARERAEGYGKLMRASLAAGVNQTSDETHVYLNYAIGSETLAQIYGDGRRIQKLQKLKRKYDPTNQFRYYMPLSHTP